MTQFLGFGSVMKLMRQAAFVSSLVCGTLAAHPAAATDCPATVDASGAFAGRIAEAAALQEGGCRAAARDLALVLLERAESEHGAASVEAADALDLLAETSYWLGDRGEREILWARRAVQIRRSLADDPRLPESLRNLGALLSVQSEPEFLAEALDAYEDARRLWESEGDRAKTKLADLLTWVAELIDDWGVEGRTRALDLPWVAEITDPGSPRGLELRREFAASGGGGLRGVRARDDPALAVAAWAVVEARRAAALDGAARSHLSAVGIVLAESLNSLGNLLNRRRFYDEALGAFEESLEVRRQVFPPEHPQIARALHNVGEARMLVGRIEEARLDLRAALEMRRALAGDRFPGVVATSLRVYGELLVLTGEPGAALELFRDALPRLRDTFGDAHWRYAAGWVSLGEVFEELAETVPAEDAYRQALAALERSPSDEAARKAEVRGRLGALLAESGRIEAGKDLLSAARETYDSLAAPPLADLARTFRGLARIARTTGRAEESLELYRRAGETLRQYDGVHPELVEILPEIAELELELDPATAEATLTEFAELVGLLGPSAYAARARLALLRAASSADPAFAARVAAEAGELSARYLASVVRVLAPSSAEDFKARRRRALDLALARLTDMLAEPTVDLSVVVSRREIVDRVWTAVAAHRGLLTIELERRYAEARRADDPELRELFANLRDARRALAQTQVRGRGGPTLAAQRGLLRVADARVLAIESRLAEKVASARPAAEGASADLAARRAALPEDAALLAYVRYGGEQSADGPGARYGVFVGRAAAPPTFVDLGPAAEIDAEVRAWREALARIEPSWAATEAVLRRRGEILRRRILDPVAASMEGVHRVHLVLDGALFLVSFAALPSPHGDGYLVDAGYSFHRLVAERDLEPAPATPTWPRTLLAIGGPSFDSDAEMATASLDAASLDAASLGAASRGAAGRDPCLGGDSLYFFPLEEAGLESREVAEIFRRDARPEARVTELGGAGATEAAFKRLAPSHQVLHVATHGFFDLSCRSTSRVRGFADLAAMPGDAVGGAVNGDGGAVSGLAFAGANRGIRGAPEEDDGILTADEIAGLDLSGVEWVVLSACETAVGRVSDGEGVLGLARGFRVAGARTLILSLWPVDDGATREWMRHLYEARFQARRPTADALRQASLEILAQRRRAGETTHPAFWAAFVAMGGSD